MATTSERTLHISEKQFMSILISTPATSVTPHARTRETVFKPQVVKVQEALVIDAVLLDTDAGKTKLNGQLHEVPGVNVRNSYIDGPARGVPS